MTEKIVILTPISLDSDTRSYKQACTLANAGYQVTVVEQFKSKLDYNEGFNIISQNPNPILFSQSSNKYSINKRYKNWLKQNENKLPFGVKQIVYFFSLVIFVFQFLWAYNIKYFFKVPKADIYILHAYHHFLLVFIKSKLAKAKYIYDAHDFYIDLYKGKELTEFERVYLGSFYRMYEKWCVNYCSKYLTVSEGLCDLYEKEFNKRPQLLRNVQDYRKQYNPDVGIRNLLSLKEDDILMVVIGQAKQGMALEQIFEVMIRLPENIYLAIVGKNFEQFSQTILDKELSEKVFLTGAVGSNQVIKFVESADISILTYYAISINYYYGLPNGLFQSLGAGLAVLFPKGLPEIAKIGEKYSIGLPIDPLNVEDVYQQIMTLVANRSLINQYKENSKKAGQEISWENEEKNFLKLIKEI
jgi:hypothetical protein